MAEARRVEAFTAARGYGPLDDRPVVRQWHAAKTTGEKLDLVFQNVADIDGTVERVQYVGGRDFLVFYSTAVTR